jgi:hypothetical protein
MPKQVEVLVKDISYDDMGRPTELHGTERVLTYKSFLYLNANPENPRYELIGEVDEKGNLVPGNPNLSAQHRQQAQHQESAAPVVRTGPTQREIELEAEVAKLKASLQGLPTPTKEVTEPEKKEPEKTKVEPVQQTGKQRGPKKKALNTVTEYVG